MERSSKRTAEEFVMARVLVGQARGVKGMRVEPFGNSLATHVAASYR